MWLRKIMGLIDKVEGARKKPDEKLFTKSECQFLVAKLRSATYKGDEFEQFYAVLKKITDQME